MNEYSNIRVRWLPIYVSPTSDAMVTMIKEKTMDQLDLIFVQGVLMDALAGNASDADIAQALETIEGDITPVETGESAVEEADETGNEAAS